MDDTGNKGAGGRRRPVGRSASGYSEGAGWAARSVHFTAHLRRAEPSVDRREAGRSTKPLIPWNLAMNFGRFCAGQLAGETAVCGDRLITGSERDLKERKCSNG